MSDQTPTLDKVAGIIDELSVGEQRDLLRGHWQREGGMQVDKRASAIQELVQKAAAGFESATTATKVDTYKLGGKFRGGGGKAVLPADSPIKPLKDTARAYNAGRAGGSGGVRPNDLFCGKKS